MQTLTEQLVEALEAIRDYEPNEVVKDDFAYDRMVENYRNAARAALDRADPEALLRENGEAVRRLGNELMEGKGR